MKMDVVLSSPGHFEDDGTPFKNEEIREWSGVDQLTGMLEQARIETGRWRAFDNGSAHSYGKMVDSRQRNSQDGSVVQKARRQVEVFQSQEPGRRVQVVRSSQWSSSRVTDKLDHQSILGTSHKFPFLKRSTSDEDIALFPLDQLEKSPNFARASKLRRSLQIPRHHSKITIPPPSPERSIGPIKSLESPYALERVIPENSDVDNCSKPDAHYANSLENHYISGNPLESHYVPISTAITLGDSNKSEICIKTGNPQFPSSPLLSQKCPGAHQVSPRSHQTSLKPQKSQITVVNLINSPKTSIVTLGFPDSNIPSATSACKKKVGFCKTEIHFAAESGKVNIVETDGKPPPTNKFRRRKRNQNPLQLKDADLGISDDDKKLWIKPEGNPRIHTTTICLGDAATGATLGDKIDFKTSGELESPKAVSEIISRGNLANVVSKDSENNKVLSTVVTTHEPTIARVEDNIPIPKNIIASKKQLTSKHSLERRRSLDLKKSQDPKTSLERKKSLEVKNSLERKKLERKKSPDRTDSAKADKSEVKPEKIEEVQRKSEEKAIPARDQKSTKDGTSLPLYMNVFGKPQDAFPVYENYRVGEEKKEKSLGKCEKEGKVTRRNKTKSPSHGVKRSPMGVRGAHGGSSSLLKSKDGTRVRTARRPPSGEGTRIKKQPMEVVYKTAVYNMKNEKLSKPTTVKSKPGPGLINDLICGVKPKTTSISSKRKDSTSSQGTKNSSQQSR